MKIDKIKKIKLLKKEITNFFFIGILVNFFYYICYLILTFIGLNIYLATTLLFLLTNLLSYKGNAKFTFKVKKSNKKSILFFYLIQFLFYILNIFLLFILVENLGLPHQIVQIFLIIGLAILNFLLLKKFVFI